MLQVRVAPDENPSCYTLCRRWMQNDPDGFASPELAGALVKSSLLTMATNKIASGAAIPQAVPHFWEMAPIVLPPLPSPSKADTEPDPPKFKAASSDGPIPIKVGFVRLCCKAFGLVVNHLLWLPA